MITSTSSYVLNKDVFGVSLQDYCCSMLPEVPFFNFPAGKANDLCPDSRVPDSGTIHLLPFDELTKIMKNGDILIFLRKKINTNPVEILKQRGWHAEIVYRDTDGVFYTCAAWDRQNVIKSHPVKDLHEHARICNGLPLEDFSVHVVRVVPPDKDSSEFDVLLNQVWRWRYIFNEYQFPEGAEWFFDPVEFDSVDKLKEIACRLIRGEKVEDVFCIQWVITVLSLALNFPLTAEVLDALGVRDAYRERWEAELGIEKVDVRPLGRLPLDPYMPIDVFRAFIATYFPERQQEFSRLLNVEDIIFPLGSKMKMPKKTLLPILPFVEVFHPLNELGIQWKYVATGMDRRFLKKKS